MGISQVSLLIKTLQPDQSTPKLVCPKEMVFQQKLLEKAYFIVKMIGPVIVWPASSDFWKALHPTTAHATCCLVVGSKRFVSQGKSNIIHSLLTDLRV